MRIRAWAPGVLAGFALTMAWSPTWAAEETLVDTVAGYQINRVNEPNNAYPCRMVRGYADPKDNNAANALAFAQLDGLFIVSLVYERWKWEAGKLYKAKFSVDNKLIDADAQWLGNGTNLAIKVPVSHLPKFNTGKKIILGFKNGSADFDLTGFKPAYEATVRCNRDAAAAAKTPDKAAEAKPIGSGIVAATSPPAAVPAPPPTPAPVPQPTPPPAPVAAPAGPLPSEDRAVAYLFALYDRWAFDACDMRTTGKQRSALDAKAAVLAPEMTAIERELLTKIQGDSNRCPPASALEAQLQLLLDNTPEDFVAKVDERARKEFQGIVRPILDRLKPPPPPAAEGKQLPSEPRIAAYLLGLTLQDVLQRCDVATTARQRSGLDAKVAALRPEMVDVESAVREAIEKPTCPGPDDATDAGKEIAAAMATYLEKSPEDFALALDAKRDGAILRDARKIVAKVRPAVPSQARMSTYLFGLVLQDKLAQCDIATTAKQRAGLDAKVASLKPEMAAVDTALRDQIKGQVQGCPAGDESADLGASLALFIEAQPEDFAAEMDKRSAARRAAAAASAERKDTPAPAAPTPTTEPKAAACKDTIFPQTAAELAAGLGERLKPFGVQDLVEKPSAGTDRRTYQMNGADIELDVLEKDGRITGFFLAQRGESSKKEWDIALATTAYIVAAFTKEPEDKVAEDVKAKLGDVSATSPRTEKFGTAGVFYVRENGAHVTLVIDNAGAATAECGR